MDSRLLDELAGRGRRSAEGRGRPTRDARHCTDRERPVRGPAPARQGAAGSGDWTLLGGTASSSSTCGSRSRPTTAPHLHEVVWACVTDRRT
jgi:hypothetical protein